MPLSDSAPCLCQYVYLFHHHGHINSITVFPCHNEFPETIQRAVKFVLCQDSFHIQKHQIPVRFFKSVHFPPKCELTGSHFNYDPHHRLHESFSPTLSFVAFGCLHVPYSSSKYLHVLQHTVSSKVLISLSNSSMLSPHLIFNNIFCLIPVQRLLIKNVYLLIIF